jgi:hypothetical protein
MDASSAEMVSLHQRVPISMDNDNSNNSNGSTMIFYSTNTRILYLVTALALVFLGANFVVLVHNKQQQLRNHHSADVILEEQTDVLDGLEQELLEREKAAKEKEDELAKREKTAKDKEEQLVEREKAAAAVKEHGASGKEVTTTTAIRWEDAAWEGMNSIKRAQVENYRDEKALMLNVHATHHGGTAFCSRIGRNGINGTVSPSFACMHDNDNTVPNPPECSISKDKFHKNGVDPEFCYSFREMASSQRPWTKEQTGPFIDAIRPYFHMVSWEFSNAVKHLDATDYEHTNLVSVLVTRDPMTRLMAGDGTIDKKYPGIMTQELNRSRWWDYATYDNQKQSDNFFLRILSSTKQPSRTSEEQRAARNHIEEGIDKTTNELMELFPTGLDESHLEHGKSLMDRFTFVLDVACFDVGMDAMGNLLQMGLPPLYKPSKSTIKSKSGTKSLSTKERIGYDDVYEYLEAKNEWDIKLYEYSKTISIVNCDALL